MSLRVLCVCKGNTCRSPMFAAKLKDHFAMHGRQDVSIESAGYWQPAKGQPAAPDWITLQEETRVNLSEHHSRWLGEVDLASFDVIYCMDAETLDEVKKTSPPSHVEVTMVNSPEGIPNPWEKGLDAYRACYQVICKAVEEVPPHR